MWKDELWEPFELCFEPDDIDSKYHEPKRRSFMELDTIYEFEYPGLFPQSLER